jgi:MoxR-like ATPase
MAGLPPDAHRVAADLTILYWLFPSGAARAETKVDRVLTVVSWKLAAEAPARSDLLALFGDGIGGVGTHYLAAQDRVIAYFLAFSRAVRAGEADPTDAEQCQALAERVAREQKGAPEARHALLNLLFPDRFEPIASQRHKDMILKAFADLTKGQTDPERGLANIRAALAPQYRDEIGFSFYRPEVEATWNPAAQADNRSGWWIEKTNVRGRPDRVEGDFAVGRALWSPQRGEGGADIYRFMREVKPGDVVLHLTDNEGFTGISRAARPLEEFGGVAGTSWGEQPSYAVRLEAYEKLDPPLPRNVFLDGIYGKRLFAINPRRRNLFYNSQRRSLNQGAYLTPLPEDVRAVLDEAYRSIGNRSLSELAGEPTATVAEPARESDLEELLQLTNLEAVDITELEELLTQKKQIILEGPPGSGKTYVAELFARFFTGTPLSGPLGSRVAMIQFHQSYAYEDFVQGIRPETDAGGGLAYRVQPGIFKRFAELAAKRPETEPYVLIIDEINRGNVSRIFGELLLLLEYRDKAIQLAGAKDDLDQFSIPENLHVIGTMNTADRSLAQVDYALRRRFFFFKLVPVMLNRAPVLESWLAKQSMTQPQRQEVLRLFLRLNERLTEELGEDFQVGHSHFMTNGIELAETQRRIWRRAIQPLLAEYFYNRRARAQLLAQFDRDELLSASGHETGELQ